MAFKAQGFRKCSRTTSGPINDLQPLDNLKTELLLNFLPTFGEFLNMFHDGIISDMTTQKSFPECTGVSRHARTHSLTHSVYISQSFSTRALKTAAMCHWISLDCSIYNIRQFHTTTKPHAGVSVGPGTDCAVMVHTQEDLQTVLNVAVTA